MSGNTFLTMGKINIKIKTKIGFLFATLLYLFTSTVVPVFANITYTYDANGNMTSDGSNCYSYNDANQVSQVKNCSNNQVIAQYIYDYQGNRIEKKVYTNGNLQQTVYSPTKEYETKKLANNTTQNTSNYYVNSDLVAKKNPNGSKNYYHNDNLGSASVLTDQTGNIVENTTYYPFGDIRSGGTKSKYLYTGQENDSETGLDYYNARYYYSHIRRFTQPDTLLPNQYDPQQLNRYSYVGNNPLTYTDPTGHIFGVDDVIEVAIGSAIVSEVATNPEVDNIAETEIANGENIASQITNDAQNLIRQNFIKGQLGEQNAGIIKNTTRIDSLTKTANYRIPDILEKSGNKIT